MVDTALVKKNIFMTYKEVKTETWLKIMIKKYREEREGKEIKRNDAR